MSHLTGDCRCPINPLALSPPPECQHWSGVAHTNLKRGLHLLMPISPSLSAHSFQSLHAPRPTLLACVSSVCPAFYCSSLPFMIYKGQPPKGSLSTLPLDWVFFLPSWLFFPSYPFFLPFVCAFFFFSLFLAVFAEQWQYETQSHRAVRLQVLEECWRERLWLRQADGFSQWRPARGTGAGHVTAGYQGDLIALGVRMKREGAPERMSARASRALCNLWQGESTTLNWKWS